ncbi:hypothetical protein HY374_03910 [Candidatus Berkelbacteria bacterium]|nr:hypothetical protein [Candidatus Berkelbacteria bacterium]
MAVKIIKNETTSEKSKDDGLFKEMDQAAKKRNCFSCGNCAIIVVLALVVLALGLASAVAATGLVRIPVLSGMVYKASPLPTRVVEPSGPANFSGLIAAKVQDPTVLATRQATFTEAELTQVLREPGADGEVILKQGQVAIDAGRAELYGQITLGGNPLVITVDVLPTSTPPGLGVSTIRLGRVTVPKTLTDVVTRTVLDMVASQMQFEAGTTLADIGVEQIRLTPGGLTITASQELLDTLQAGAEASSELPADGASE